MPLPAPSVPPGVAGTPPQPQIFHLRRKDTIDLRRFPSLPRSTKNFERLYKGRTAVERVNGRLKVFWGVDDGNVRGSRRFHAQVGVVMAVHAAFAMLLASAPRYEGQSKTLGHTRLSAIACAKRRLPECRKPSKATNLSVYRCAPAWRKSPRGRRFAARSAGHISPSPMTPIL